MAVIVNTNFETVTVISDLGFGNLPLVHDSVVEENADPDWEILGGIGYAGSRGLQPISGSIGAMSDARLYRTDAAHGHSGTVQYRIRNAHYNYQYGLDNGGVAIYHYNRAPFGDQLAGYGEYLFYVFFTGGQDNPERAVVVMVAVPPATYADPVGHGMPAGGTPVNAQWLRYTFPFSPPLVATEWVKVRYSLTTSTTADGVTVNRDGRFCVSVNDQELMAATNITLGAEWGNTLGGALGDPPPEPRNPDNIWNTIEVEPAGQIDDLYVSSDWEGCASVPPDPSAPPFEPPDTVTQAHPIRRLRRAPHVAQEDTRVFYRAFELDLERGIGLATGQGSDPLVMLRLSRDGGHTWGEPLLLEAGRMGDYTRRLLARRLGHGRDVVFEITVSDPVAWSIVGAWLELDAGTS
jgi:hypothetical protein